MLKGPQSILNPNRPHCCPLPEGEDPIGAHIPLLVNWNIFRQSFPILQPACLDWHPPYGERHGPQAGMLRDPHCVVWSAGPCSMQWSHCTLISPRQSQDGGACSQGRVSYQNPTTVFCHLSSKGSAGGADGWPKTFRHHPAIPTHPRVSKELRHLPKWTKISNMSSVQHADLGVPNSPFRGLSKYTPHTPPPPSTGHRVGTTQATMTTTTENALSGRIRYRP